MPRRRTDIEVDVAQQLNINDEGIVQFLRESRHRLRPKTLEAYGLGLEFARRNWPGKGLLAWTKEDVAGFVAWMEEQGSSAATVRARLSTLSSFYKFHIRVETDGIEKNPVAQVDRPKLWQGSRRPVYLNKDEIQRLLNHQEMTFDFYGHSVHDIRGRMERSYLTVMLLTGVRVGKLVELELNDFADTDTDKPFLAITDAKGGKDRDIPLHPLAVTAYKDWVAVRPEAPTGHVYINLRTTRPLSVSTIQRRVARLAAEAGIEKRITPHKLRHSCATLFLTDGQATVADLQLLLGHSHPSTTLIYLHSNTARAQEVVGNVNLWEEEK